MSDNHLAPPQVTVTLSAQEWGVVTAALYEAPLPLKLTGPVVNKLQQQVQTATQPREGATTS